MQNVTQEHETRYVNAWLVLPLWLAYLAWTLLIFAAPLITGRGEPSLWGIFSIPIIVFIARGFTILEPNQAGVMVFFGKYAGTLRDDGFFWVNPFYKCRKISLRAHYLNTPTLKVNDLAGNPIEVAAVIVWRVYETARAEFDVEDYEEYITVQSESAVRQVVSSRWYDGDDAGQNSLRGDLDTVARLLSETIQSHVDLAGLEIIEARISHLAYAPEIAGAMLRRQQAVAVVSARSHIVEGAVGMVELALQQLEAQDIVALDAEDRVRLVANLMTVLVADGDTQPVFPVGQ